MNATGRIEDDGRTLVLTRRFDAPIDDVWASITDSERLGRWFGTWTGDPATGSVMVTLTAEPEPVPPARHDIRMCEPPRLLSIAVGDDGGTWLLAVELSEIDGGTMLVLRQEELDPASLLDVAPGWEWYLDRLVAAVAGEEPPGLDVFETVYLPMGASYASMAGSG